MYIKALRHRKHAAVFPEPVDSKHPTRLLGFLAHTCRGMLLLSPPNARYRQKGLSLAEAIKDDERLAGLGEAEIMQEFREKVGRV